MDRWSEKSIMQMYILENKIPIPVEDLILWGRWFENVENKRVAFTEFDNLRVSTVFLGIGRESEKRRCCLKQWFLIGTT